MNMANLLKETDAELKAYGRSFEDVLWIATADGEISLEDFKKIASCLYYDAGYGSQQIDPSLIIVGDGWWFERREYDGSEWWEFCNTPVRPNNFIPHPTKDSLKDEW